MNKFVTRPLLQRMIRLNSAIISEIENNKDDIFNVETNEKVSKQKVKKVIAKFAEIQCILKGAMNYVDRANEVNVPLFYSRELDKLKIHTRELIKCYSDIYSETYRGRVQIRSDKRKTMRGLEQIQRAFRNERIALGQIESLIYQAHGVTITF